MGGSRPLRMGQHSLLPLLWFLKAEPAAGIFYVLRLLFLSSLLPGMCRSILRDFFLSYWRSFLLFVVLYSLLRLLSIVGRGELEDPAVFMALCALGELLLLFVFLGYKWQKYSYKTLTWMSISFVLAGIVTGNLGGRIGIPAVSYIGVSVSFVVLGGIAILSMFFRVLRQVFKGVIGFVGKRRVGECRSLFCR